MIYAPKGLSVPWMVPPWYPGHSLGGQRDSAGVNTFLACSHIQFSPLHTTGIAPEPTSVAHRSKLIFARSESRTVAIPIASFTCALQPLPTSQVPLFCSESPVPLTSLLLLLPALFRSLEVSYEAQGAPGLLGEPDKKETQSWRCL